MNNSKNYLENTNVIQSKIFLLYFLIKFLLTKYIN